MTKMENKDDPQTSTIRGGSFQTMMLMPSLLKAIQRKGYRLPTPIQRKCIPPLMSGRDLVAMARTGSGKTAAFLVPLIQKLKCHSIRVGVRGLVLSPSRELAIQTYNVVKELTKGTDLRHALLTGGTGIEEQFLNLSTNPDIIVATPGRLTHLLVETGLSLRMAEMVIWDEADRLAEDSTLLSQMTEISARLPKGNGKLQTALFSATLPAALSTFAQADLHDPLLIKVDGVDGNNASRISPDLQLSFLSVKSESKDAALLTLLMDATATSSDSLGKCVIFCSTKHHVEYLQELLNRAFSLKCCYIYGSLDQEARTLAIEEFRGESAFAYGEKKRNAARILIVTDVAARGIDIPLLDTVINYDHPPTAKLFLHRVGRVARAGRKGHAISLVSGDELPYLFDLALFLSKGGVSLASTMATSATNITIGSIPSFPLSSNQDRLDRVDEINGLGLGIQELRKVSKNAFKLYKKTRPNASPEGHRRAKAFLKLSGHALDSTMHPLFADASTTSTSTSDAKACQDMLSAIKGYKAPSRSRQDLGLPIFAKKGSSTKQILDSMEVSDASDVTNTTSTSSINATETTAAITNKSPTHYLSYTSDRKSSSSSSFMEQAKEACLDLFPGMATKLEDPLIDGARRATTSKREPGLRSRGTPHLNNTKMIKTDVGTKVPASYRSDLYSKWTKKSHLDVGKVGEEESVQGSQRARTMLKEGAEKRHWRRNQQKGNKK